LSGNGLQPSSIITPGPTKSIGSVQIPGNQVYDPAVDEVINAYNVQVKALQTQLEAFDEKYKHRKKKREIAEKLFNAQIDQIKTEIAAFEKRKTPGYTLVRTQWYKEAGTSVVSQNDSRTEQISITLGVTKEVSNSTTDTIGTTFGTSTTVAENANVNIGAQFEIASGSLGGGVSHSKTTTQSISHNLQISESSSTVSSSSQTNTVTYNAVGGENGARYVNWQIVDRFVLTRNSDGTEISDTYVQSSSQNIKYSLLDGKALD